MMTAKVSVEELEEDHDDPIGDLLNELEDVIAEASQDRWDHISIKLRICLFLIVCNSTGG
jgi:hypothetical protein